MRSARRFKMLLLWSGLLVGLIVSRMGMACSVNAPTPTASFGSLSSLGVGTMTQQTQALPSAGLRCPGSVLGLIVSGDRVNATLSSVNGGRLRNEAGDTIGYSIFADAAGQAPLTLGTAYNYYNSYILGLLGLLSGQAADIPMYFRTQPGTAANVSAGTYTDTLTVRWNWSICTGIGIGSLCLGRNSGNGTSVISLSLTVSPDCAINAPNLDFGSAPLIQGFDPVTQTISIRCTKGANYTVGISDGMHASGGQRRLEAGGNYLRYELYQGVSSQARWGNQGSARRGSGQADIQPGNYDGLSWQGFTYRAEILPNQATPPPATYTDTLVVDVAF
ncbi:Csu type fimbrial protein [Salinicola socius]|uniref:Spore coat protein U/FanG domain-containing protein n=1 Tax=Salinicola socius TaxID=404433 RepID=A0A1Q8SU07_9GAMM|nr:spore coat protein U domain-containing protein [Salinicola socius]OLO04930.1 hypothetical protein BTW07_06825 [Salinicola socius]